MAPEGGRGPRGRKRRSQREEEEAPEGGGGGGGHRGGRRRRRPQREEGEEEEVTEGGGGGGGGGGGPGECFSCLVDVVPVKNEDGVVIMFILNFEVMNDESLIHRTDLNHRLPTWLVTGRPRGFKLRLPLLRSLSNSKMSLEDVEVGHISSAAPLPLHQESQPEALNLQDHDFLSTNRLPPLGWSQDCETSEPAPTGLQAPPPPLTQSSPCVAPYQHRLSLNPDSGSNGSLSHSRSRESFHSLRRASSVDEIEAMRPEWERKNRRTSIRPGSTGAVNSKSTILNSTSDSDLMRYRTISKIPQITLNFVDFKPDPLLTLPTGDIDLIAPCKLIDRTHHVTEKVTQVRAPPVA
uniref:Uncharacterized protein n=1 Tax=Knipowitschia caucasica TaxID=637954 RepID=A0AAV2LA45_KNICA